MMRFGSLFSGIGGFDLGLERAGMACIWQVEIDPFCRRVLAKHWPHVERYEDVRHVGKHNLDPVDLVCGGFPCQDVSVAGKRAGLAGERSGLWFEFHRVVAELKPRWVVVENVPGLLSSNGGRDFATVIRGLVECGYGVAWRIFDAQYFGVPQRRRRVFIVGCLGNGRAAQVLFESEGVSGDSAQGRTPGEEVTGTLAPGAHSGGFNGRDIESGLYAFSSKDSGVDVAIDVSPTLRSMNFNRSHINGGGQIAVFESRYARNGRGAPDTVVPPLKAQSGGTGKGDGAPLVFHGKASHHQSMNPGAQASTLDASKELTIFQSSQSGIREVDTHATLDSNNGGRRQNGIVQPAGIRRLTPTECERLQGFPDGWTAGQSDGARYRQLGNAVAVPVIEWIGRRIINLEDGV